MKVRISYTVYVDDRYRRAINHHFGKPGLASRTDVQQWMKSYGESCDADIRYELDRDEPEDETEQNK